MCLFQYICGMYGFQRVSIRKYLESNSDSRNVNFYSSSKEKKLYAFCTAADNWSDVLWHMKKSDTEESFAIKRFEVILIERSAAYFGGKNPSEFPNGVV